MKLLFNAILSILSSRSVWSGLLLSLCAILLSTHPESSIGLSLGAIALLCLFAPKSFIPISLSISLPLSYLLLTQFGFNWENLTCSLAIILITSSIFSIKNLRSFHNTIAIVFSIWALSNSLLTHKNMPQLGSELFNASIYTISAALAFSATLNAIKRSCPSLIIFIPATLISFYALTNPLHPTHIYIFSTIFIIIFIKKSLLPKFSLPKPFSFKIPRILSITTNLILLSIGILWSFSPQSHFFSKAHDALDSAWIAYRNNNVDVFQSYANTLLQHPSQKSYHLLALAQLKFHDNPSAAKELFLKSNTSPFIQGIALASHDYWSHASEIWLHNLSLMQPEWELLILKAIKSDDGLDSLHLLAKNNHDFRMAFWKHLDDSSFIKHLQRELSTNQHLQGFSKQEINQLYLRWATSWEADYFLAFHEDNPNLNNFKAIAHARNNQFQEALNLTLTSAPDFPQPTPDNRPLPKIRYDFKVNKNTNSGLTLYNIAIQNNDLTKAINILNTLQSLPNPNPAIPFQIANLHLLNNNPQQAWLALHPTILQAIFNNNI